MGYIYDARSQSNAAKVDRATYNKMRRELPFVQAQQQSEIDLRQAQAGQANALTETENRLRDWEIMFKKAQAEKEAQEVTELLSSAPAREAAASVQNLYHKDFLQMYKDDPKATRSLLSAKMRLDATDADIKAVALQDEMRWRLLDQVKQM